MTNSYQPWLHRFALSTVCVAMVTLIAGALVTSKNAGMAFRDWPTSDGHPMLTYPWLADFARNGDKFLEHGHRLAGVLIGLWSIALAVLLTRCERRRWVKVAGMAVLLGVIIQGILGGLRVWLDERGLAMLHGIAAACVLSLMACVATALSRGWQTAAQRRQDTVVRAALPMAVAVLVCVALQYLLGGLIRHQGTGLHEHLGLGVLTLVLVIANTFVADSCKSPWVGQTGWLLLGVVLVQVALGGAAWVTKFGFAPAGYVAVADSIGQVVFRTAHTVVGILVFMTSVVHLVRVLRVRSVAILRSVSAWDEFAAAATARGGAA